MNITRLRLLLCLMFSYPFVVPLQAQSTSSPPSDPAAIVSSMTVESFQQRVQALGFATTRGNADGKLDAYFTFMAEGRKVGGLMVNPTVVELFVSFKDGALPEDLNEWNRTHFGTAAFIDQKGNAVLRSDLVLEGGVTVQNLDSFITRFRDVAAAYARFIIEHKKAS